MTGSYKRQKAAQDAEELDLRNEGYAPKFILGMRKVKGKLINVIFVAFCFSIFLLILVPPPTSIVLICVLLILALRYRNFPLHTRIETGNRSPISGPRLYEEQIQYLKKGVFAASAYAVTAVVLIWVVFEIYAGKVAAERANSAGIDPLEWAINARQTEFGQKLEMAVLILFFIALWLIAASCVRWVNLISCRAQLRKHPANVLPSQSIFHLDDKDNRSRESRPEPSPDSAPNSSEVIAIPPDSRRPELPLPTLAELSPVGQSAPSIVAPDQAEISVAPSSGKRGPLIMLAVLAVSALLVWAMVMTHRRSSTKPIQVNPNYLVGTWRGHARYGQLGDQTMDITLKVTSDDSSAITGSLDVSGLPYQEGDCFNVTQGSIAGKRVAGGILLSGEKGFNSEEFDPESGNWRKQGYALFIQLNSTGMTGKLRLRSELASCPDPPDNQLDLSLAEAPTSTPSGQAPPAPGWDRSNAEVSTPPAPPTPSPAVLSIPVAQAIKQFPPEFTTSSDRAGITLTVDGRGIAEYENSTMVDLPSRDTIKCSKGRMTCDETVTPDPMETGDMTGIATRDGSFFAERVRASTSSINTSIGHEPVTTHYKVTDWSELGPGSYRVVAEWLLSNGCGKRTITINSLDHTVSADTSVDRACGDGHFPTMFEGITLSRGFSVAAAVQSNPSNAPIQPVSATSHSEIGSGDICEAVALRDVLAIDNPSSIIKRGEHDTAITQYRVWKETGVKSFCSHGGYCYPAYATVNGEEVESLHLTNCEIDKSSHSRYEDEWAIMYGLVPILSKIPADTLKRVNFENRLRDMGLCSACAGNVAQWYTQRPTSRCGMLAKHALEGDPDAVKELQAFPSYCTWEYK